MKISEKAVDRPRVVIVGALLVLSLAALAALKIPIERTPPITLPVVLVAVPYPGAQPAEVERDVTRKIEDQLSRLDDVDYITSTSMRGSSVTQIVFLEGIDVDQARTDVQNLVDEIRRELPQGREVEPQVTDISFDDFPIILITISGDASQRDLKEIAEDIGEEIETIPGVASAEVFGGLEREVHVNVDGDLLMQYGLTLDDVQNTLVAYNRGLPAGSLLNNRFEFRVRSDTKFQTPADIAEAVITNVDGRLIRIKDVAEVRDTHRRPKSISHLNGQRSVTLRVMKRADINMLRTVGLIKRRVNELGRRYPGLHIEATRDVSDEIRIMFETLGSSALYGVVLVLAMLLLVMGFRSAVLVTMALPLCLAVSLVFLYAFGLSVNNMVIFSFILVLGMVVDGAIIVVENIYRHAEEGKPRIEAAKLGIREVGLPVIAADLTTVAAFLPMLLVSGVMGEFMGVMPQVVTVALFGSVLVDHFLLPVLSSRWLRPSRRVAGPERHESVGKTRRPTAVRPPEPPGREESRFRIKAVYERLLRFALDHRWMVVVGAGYAVLWAALMLVTGRIPFSFFPESDRGQFDIYFELPIGYSIHESERVAYSIADPLIELFDTGEMRSFVTTIGTTSALSNRLDNDPAVGPEFGSVLVELVQPNQRERSLNEVLAELRRKLPTVPGAEIRIRKIQEGPPSGSPVAVRLQGDDLEQMARLGERIAKMLRSIDGTRDVKSDYRPDSPEIVVEPVPSLAGLYDLTEGDIATAVQTAILGTTPIEMYLDDEEVYVRLQLTPSQQRSMDNVRDLLLRGANGKLASVEEVARVGLDTGLYSINRRDRRRIVTVRSEVDTERRFTPDMIFAELRPRLAELDFEPSQSDSTLFLGDGVTARFTGENEDRDKGFRELFISMTVGIICIAAILTVQFNSFRLMVIVLLAIPLSFVGVVFGLWFMGFNFDLASFIGLVSLAGIVVNDAIVMVDYSNQLRRRGMPKKEALVLAGKTRMRPVFLTTITTIGGLLPLFLNLSGGNEFWQPLTGAVIFGLLFATMLTLVVIPVFYSLVTGRDD